jgi:hypothetical protein
VYSVYGYSTHDEPTEPPYWAGAAADLARQVAPVVAWPSQCAQVGQIVEGEGGHSVYNLEIFSIGNPWIAPWISQYTGPVALVKRSGRTWALEEFKQISRKVNPITEALAFFGATGQAVLPRSATEFARIWYDHSNAVPDVYPRIQDIERDYAGWVRW